MCDRLGRAAPIPTDQSRTPIPAPQVKRRYTVVVVPG